MSIGKAVRKALGPLEAPISNVYRSYFVDLDDLGRTLSRLGSPRRILEIGCGDGFLANRIVESFPDASYVGIDRTDAPGRLYSGDPARAKFKSMPVADLDSAEGFDEVLIVDVLHHVPELERDQLMKDAHDRLRAGGHLVVKEWERRRNLPHALAVAADRYIGGEEVAFATRAELISRLTKLFPADAIVLEARVPPQRNNLLVVLQKVA
jgi:2-polyprenyl-3-methyl-5-hydroxy-6-metoxy-1,4-benzoquinol methylase